METLKRWTGTDLAPLPYESLANILECFSWNNALDASTVRLRFTRNGAGRKIDIQRFAYESFGQVVIDIYDEERIRISSTWYCEYFRFCPICLQELYHSTLFQYLQLMTCPLHDVSLTIYCQSCGATTPLMRTGEILFNRPYECNECGAPCAGAAPDRTAHLLMRANVAVLIDRLGSVANWWTSTATQRRKIDCMLRAKDRSYYACHRPNEMLQALARRSGTEPPGIRLNANDWPATSRICWRQRMAYGRDLAGTGVALMRRRHYEESMYTHALRVLLRRVAQKLPTKELYLVVELERFDYAGSEHLPDELLAMGFMRLQIEGAWNIEDTRMLRPFYSATPIARDWPHGKTYLDNAPRIAFYSAYLALFATWYHHIRRVGWAGAWEIFRKAPRPSAMVLMRNELWCRRGDEWTGGEIELPDEAWFDGEAATVAISGLPLFPYRSHPLKSSPPLWDVENIGNA